MRNALLVFVLFSLLVPACAQAPTPIDEPPGAGEPPASTPTEKASNTDEPSAPTKLPVDLTPAQLAAVKALSETLPVPIEEIQLVSTEAVEWSNGCLDVQEEGVMCTEALVPGFRINLEANGRQVEYRTNEDGAQVRPATILMRWKREGGIAGFCDVLTAYLSGEVHRGSCKSGDYSEERLSDVLSEAEIAKLNEWVQEYGTVSIDASDPKGVADGMVVTLEFIGLGSQETITSVNEKELLEFAQSLSQSSPLK